MFTKQLIRIAAFAGASMLALEAGAQEPVEYVKVCQLGTGFIYIPGTETCLQLNGNIQPSVGDDRGRNLCDALGLSGLTISSDTNCLQITGSVQYEFLWGDYDGRSGNAQQLTDILHGGTSISAVPYFVYQTPTFLGWGVTEQPLGTLLNPAFDVGSSHQGFGATIGIDPGFDFGMVRIDGLNFNVERTTAHATGGGMQFLNGFGVSSVGNTPGVYIGFPTDVISYDYQSLRTFAGFDAQFGVPLIAATGGTTPFVLSLDFGVNAGAFSQTDNMVINTSTPLFGVNAGSTIIYDTALNGTTFGGTVGLGIEGLIFQEMYDPGPFDDSGPIDTVNVVEDFLNGQGNTGPLGTFVPTFGANVFIGYNTFNTRGEFAVNAQGLGGALNHVSNNAVDFTNGMFTGGANASLGLTNGSIDIGVTAGVKTSPSFIYTRPDSDLGGNPLDPTLTIIPNVGFSGSISANAGF
jgi:hypothetical protein